MRTVGPKKGRTRQFRVALRRLENGDVLAYCTSLPGAHAQEGDLDAALASMRGVLTEIIDLYRTDGQPVPLEPVPAEAGDTVVATFAMDVGDGASPGSES